MVRWARALTLASVMLSAGLLGHASAGGVAPPAALLAPMLVILTMGVAPFLDAPATTPRLVALVLGGQGILHVVLELVGSSAPPSSSTMAGHPAMAHTVSHVVAGDSHVSFSSMGGAHLGMLAAHAGAALVVALWLAAGERAAWTVVDVASLAVVRAWRVVRDARSAVAVVVALTGRRSRSGWMTETPIRRSVWVGRGGLSRRGPPLVCAA